MLIDMLDMTKVFNTLKEAKEANPKVVYTPMYEDGVHVLTAYWFCKVSKEEYEKNKGKFMEIFPLDIEGNKNTRAIRFLNRFSSDREYIEFNNVLLSVNDELWIIRLHVRTR